MHSVSVEDFHWFSISYMMKGGFFMFFFVSSTCVTCNSNIEHIRGIPYTAEHKIHLVRYRRNRMYVEMETDWFILVLFFFSSREMLEIVFFQYVCFGLTDQTKKVKQNVFQFCIDLYTDSNMHM